MGTKLTFAESETPAHATVMIVVWVIGPTLIPVEFPVAVDAPDLGKPAMLGLVLTVHEEGRFVPLQKTIVEPSLRTVPGTTRTSSVGSVPGSYTVTDARG